jgi:putative NADPH-quinone reductase
LLLCHPQAGSFNHAVAERARKTLAAAGHEVLFHDLYQEGFDPVLPLPEYRRGVSFDEQVVAQVRDLERCGGLVFVHPEWWGQPPAMLKGWVDRVLRPGVAYEPAAEGPSGEVPPDREPAPLLGGKAALVLATRDAGARSGLLEKVWLEGVFAFCGIRNAVCLVLHDLRRLGPAQRQEWLAQVERALLGLFPPPQGDAGAVEASSPDR